MRRSGRVCALACLCLCSRLAYPTEHGQSDRYAVRVFANGGCHEGDMFADFDRVSCDHCCTFFPAVGSVLVRGGYTIRFQSQCDVKEPNLYACANGPIRYDRLGSLGLHPTLSLHHVCCVLANA